MSKYFDLNNKQVNVDLRRRREGEGTYKMSMYIFLIMELVHQLVYMEVKGDVISGTIQGGLCFTLPIILPDLPKNHPCANM